jgi:dihydrofolate reductase
MANLIYFAVTSLDGYIEDAEGNFDFSAPDEEVHAFINDVMRPTGTYLHGRLIYNLMVYWETADKAPDVPPYVYDFARIWQAADKVVYSTTLEAPSTARTRIERRFDADALRQLKSQASRDIGVGGSTLAAQVIEAGLVDEYHLILSPVIVGGGKRALPEGLRADLELLDERRFTNGMVYVRYRTRSAGTGPI